MIWKLVDRQTGDENAAITWYFTLGDRVKIRLVNEMEGSEHPMHHPFHIHAAGRFLVLSRQGVPEVSNSGLWMAHCHIAENTQMTVVRQPVAHNCAHNARGAASVGALGRMVGSYPPQVGWDR